MRVYVYNIIRIFFYSFIFRGHDFFFFTCLRERAFITTFPRGRYGYTIYKKHDRWRVQTRRFSSLRVCPSVTGCAHTGHAPFPQVYFYIARSFFYGKSNNTRSAIQFSPYDGHFFRIFTRCKFNQSLIRSYKTLLRTVIVKKRRHVVVTCAYGF